MKLPSIITAALLLIAASSMQAQWTVKASKPYVLAGIHFPSARTGYAVGADSVLKTTDAGETWGTLPFSAGGQLTTVFFVDEGKGFVAGEGGIIYRTENGGASWTKLSTGTLADLRDIFFTGSTTGCAVGDSTTFLKTTDGGTSWSKTLLGTERPRLIAVDFPTPDVGYAATDAFTIYKTTDGGSNWTATSDAIQLGMLYDIFFTSADTGFAASDYPWGVFRTTDGGKTWNGLGFCYPRSIDFPSSTVGYYITEQELVRTRDGGLNWTDTLGTGVKDGTMGFTGLQFINDTVGFVLGHGASGDVIFRVDFRTVTAGVEEHLRSSAVRIYSGMEQRTVRIEFGADASGPAEIAVFSVLGEAVAHRHLSQVSSGQVDRLQLSAGNRGVQLVEVMVNGTRTVECIVVR